MAERVTALGLNGAIQQSKITEDSLFDFSYTVRDLTVTNERQP